MRLLFRLIFLATLLTLTASVSVQDSPALVTILYGAMGKSQSSSMVGAIRLSLNTAAGVSSSHDPAGPTL
jgi:hypothetical protein